MSFFCVGEIFRSLTKFFWGATYFREDLISFLGSAKFIVPPGKFLSRVGNHFFLVGICGEFFRSLVKFSHGRLDIY